MKHDLGTHDTVSPSHGTWPAVDRRAGAPRRSGPDRRRATAHGEGGPGRSVEGQQCLEGAVAGDDAVIVHRQLRLARADESAVDPHG